ncbi:hypothetical protein STENM327S_05108 [Streptomyces tendae]
MHGQMRVDGTEMDLPVPPVGQLFRRRRRRCISPNGRFLPTAAWTAHGSCGSIPLPAPAEYASGRARGRLRPLKPVWAGPRTVPRGAPGSAGSGGSAPDNVHYKDTELLRGFISTEGGILEPPRHPESKSQQDRQLGRVIKTWHAR